MRYSRQNKILELISQNEIETQEKLASLLKDSGFEVTQATISRDIKELQLIKTLSSKGKYKYTAGISYDSPVTDRFLKIFKDTIKHITFSGNIIVIKTLTGCAKASGEALDSLNLPHQLGSVAGSNTVIVIVDSEENTKELVDKFNELL